MLPSEVLDRIFVNLPRENQFACLSVCKSWYLAAGRLYYQIIQIDEYNSGNEIPRLSDWIKKCGELPVGQFVKRISIENKGLYRIHPKNDCAIKENFFQLLELCPNLREMAIRSDSIFWKYLCETPKVTKLRCIRKIGTQRLLYRMQHFYQATYQYRMSITDLEVHCSYDEFLQEGFDNLFDYLSGFTKLQNLSITQGDHQQLIYFEQLLQTCKHLTKLNYQLDHPFFRPNSPGSWSAYSSMQELNLYLPNFDIQSLRYVKCRFVNMRRMALRLNQNDEDQRLRCSGNLLDITINTVYQFFQNDFMQMIEALDYSHLFFEISGKSYLEEFINQFYHLKCSTKASVTASYVMHAGRAERTQISLMKERKVSNTPSIDINYCFVRDTSANLPPLLANNVQYTLPYIQHLQSYGASLKSLKITHTAQMRRKDILNILLMLELCSNLEHLVIRFVFSYFPYKVSPSFQSQCIQEQYENSQVKINPKLKSLTLDGTYISSLLLNIIATNNPNIEQLSLIRCILKCDKHQVPDSFGNNVIHFDLHILQLKSLVFDVSPYHPITEMTAATPKVCIVIEKEGGFCNYYLERRQCSQSDGNLFEHVSNSYYNKNILPVKRKSTVLWFTLNSLASLELHHRENKEIFTW